MAYPGAPKDGKSDVDRPFLPERQGQAKAGFDRATTQPAEKTASTQRQAGDQGRVSESIKKNAPGMSLEMAGGGPVKAKYAAERLSKEHAADRKQNMIKNAAAKKMEKSSGIEQNKSKSQDKGRE